MLPRPRKRVRLGHTSIRDEIRCGTAHRNATTAGSDNFSDVSDEYLERTAQAGRKTRSITTGLSRHETDPVLRAQGLDAIRSCDGALHDGDVR